MMFIKPNYFELKQAQEDLKAACNDAINRGDVSEAVRVSKAMLEIKDEFESDVLIDWLYLCVGALNNEIEFD